MRLKKDKSGDTVGRPSWRSSLPGDPGAEFFCEKPQHMKNSLNFANTCLKVVDTRRNVGQTITFDGSKSTVPSGQTLTYAWNFGDNSTGTGVSPTHTYSTGGTFTVSLTITGWLPGSSATGGGTNTATTTATIAALLVANPGGPYSGNGGQVLTFGG